jgi:hydrogenase maturation factor
MGGERLMCTSRYFRVVEVDDDDSVVAEGVDGCRYRLALIAYEGPPLHNGVWIVAHAGYALSTASEDEVSDMIGELRRVPVIDPEHRPVEISSEAS